jgi:hypothetical protein
VRQDVARVGSAGWIDGLVTFLDVLNDAFFVDHERGAIAIATLFVEYAIALHYRALEIAQQRKGNLNLFGKLAVGGNAVNTDAENLGFGSSEFGDISLIRL